MRLKPQVLQLVSAVVMIALSHAVPLNRFDSDGNSLYLERRNETSFDREFSSVCVIDDVLYQTGDPVPPPSPCERCTCQPPTISCSPLQCDYKPNCKALKMSDQCCTIYQCECEHNGRVYQNGERLETPENPCDVCYCRGGEVSCTRIECYKRDDCEPQYVPGRCCPKYDHCPPTDQPRHEKTRPQFVRTEFNRDRTSPVNQVVHQRTGLLDLENEASEDVTATALPTASLDQHTNSTVGILSSVSNPEKLSPAEADIENFNNMPEKLPTNILNDEARFASDVSESQLTDSRKASSVLKLVPISPKEPGTGTTSTHSNSEEGSGTTSSDENVSTSKEDIVVKSTASSSEIELVTASGDGEGSGSEIFEQRTESNLPTTLITVKTAQEILRTHDITTDSGESEQTTVLPAFSSGLLDTTLTAGESTEATETTNKELTTEGLFIILKANTNHASVSQEVGTVTSMDSTDKISESKEADGHNTETTEGYSETTKITANATLAEFRRKEFQPISNSEEGSGDSTTEIKILEDELTTAIPERLQESNKAAEHTEHDTTGTTTENGVHLTNSPTDDRLTSETSGDNARIKTISSSNAVKIFITDKELAADQAPEGTATESATVSFTNLENSLLGLPIAQDLVNNVMDVVLAVTEESNNEETLATEGRETENVPTEAVVVEKVESGTESVMEQTEIPTATEVEITTVIPHIKLQKSSFLQTDDSLIDSNILPTTTDNGVMDEGQSSFNQQEEVALTTLPSELDEITVTTEKSEPKNVQPVTSSEELTTIQPDFQTSVPHLRIAQDIGYTQLDDLGTEQSTGTPSPGTEQLRSEKIKVQEEVAQTTATESETTTQQSAEKSPDVFVRLASETSDVSVEPTGTTGPDVAHTELPQSTTTVSEETTKRTLSDEETTVIDFRAGWPQQDMTEKTIPIKSQEKEPLDEIATLENSETKLSDSQEGTTPEIDSTNIPEDVTFVLPGTSNLKERAAIKFTVPQETESTTEESKDEEQSTEALKQVNEEITTSIPAEPSTIISETISGEHSELKERFTERFTIIPQEESTVTPSAVESITDRDLQSTDSLPFNGTGNIGSNQTEKGEIIEEINTTYKPISVESRIYEVSSSSEQQQSDQEVTTDVNLDTTVSLISVKNEETSETFQTVDVQSATERITSIPPDSIINKHHANSQIPESSPNEQSSTSAESTESATSSAQNPVNLVPLIQERSKETIEELSASSSTEQSTDLTEQNPDESATKQSIENTSSNAENSTSQKSVLLDKSKEDIQKSPLSSSTEESIEDSYTLTTQTYLDSISNNVRDVISQESIKDKETNEEIKEASESSPTEQNVASTDQDSNESTTESNSKDTVPLSSDIEEHMKEIPQEISTVSTVTGEHEEEEEVTTLPRDWLKSDNSSETDETTEEVQADATDVSTQDVSLTTGEITTEKSIFGSIPRRNDSTSQNETASADQTESTSTPDSSATNEKSDEHVAKARSINTFDVNSGNDNSFITPQEGLTHSSHSRYASSYTSNIDGFPVLDDFFTRLFHHRDEDQPAVF